MTTCLLQNSCSLCYQQYNIVHTVAQKSVPILYHFEKIRELWDIKKKSDKALAGQMKGLALGIPKLLWSYDLAAMEARYRYFKMTCHWDTLLRIMTSIFRYSISDHDSRPRR